MKPDTKLQPANSEPSTRSLWGRMLNGVGAAVCKHPFMLALLLLAWYVLLVAKWIGRPLWYDELYTYYIAQQPTWARMFEAIRAVDLNPPLNYILTRWSLQVFGEWPWAARLPALVGFGVAGVAVFLLVRRRATAIHGAIGVLLLWGSPFLMYAAEARPYALLLACSALLLLGWDYAVSDRRKMGLAIAGLAGLGLLFSHILGLFPLGAVWAGEAVRSWKRRQIDRGLLLALVIPLVATITYGPLVQSYGEVVFPEEAKASPLKAYYLYFAVLRWMWRPLIALVVVAWLCRRTRPLPAASQRNTIPTHIGVTLGLLFVIPLGVTVLFMLSGGAFFDRYGLPIALAIAMGIPLLFAQLSGEDAHYATRALVVIAVLLGIQTAGQQLVRATSRVVPEKAALKIVNVVAPIGSSPFKPWWKKRPVPEYIQREKQQAPLVKSLETVRPGMPIVAASELTFLEMDNRESATVVKRLHYLTSREASIQIAHRSYSEEVARLREYFPIRATVEPYRQFIAKHDRFLVLGAYEYPGDWVLRKLEMDGASLHVIARYSGYKDTDLYEVSLPSPGRKTMTRSVD